MMRALRANYLLVIVKILLSVTIKAQSLLLASSSSSSSGKAVSAVTAFITSQHRCRHDRLTKKLMIPSSKYLSLMPPFSTKFSLALALASSANNDNEEEALSDEKHKEVDNGDDKDDDDDDDEESAPPPKAKRVEDILRDLHRSGLPFRIVVIGNGAILETTQTLSPNFKSTISPKTNEKLITISNTDQSFEFHVKVDVVSKVTFTEMDKKTTTLNGENAVKTLRIVRFLDDVGKPMCSFILADGGSEEGKKFFRDVTIRYGYEVQL